MAGVRDGTLLLIQKRQVTEFRKPGSKISEYQFHFGIDIHIHKA